MNDIIKQYKNYLNKDAMCLFIFIKNLNERSKLGMWAGAEPIASMIPINHMDLKWIYALK